jgi:hypothetical protein
LFPHLEKAWPPLIAKEANGRPVAFPKLRKIFAVDGFGDAKEIQFSDDFEHHIAAMIEGVGKNSAAAYCVDKLGFAYINGVLQWEGLQFGKLGQRGFRGLSLSLDYGGNSWGSGDGGAIAQGATAKAVAAFLTALENRNLVSKDASDGMTGHMLLASSWMKSGLTSKGRTPSSNLREDRGLRHLQRGRRLRAGRRHGAPTLRGGRPRRSQFRGAGGGRRQPRHHQRRQCLRGEAGCAAVTERPRIKSASTRISDFDHRSVTT